MTSNLKTESELAIRAAREAGDSLAANMSHPGAVLSDAGKDIKHEADGRAERIILDLLAAESSHPVLAEESGEVGIVESGSPYWVVDPLDGTMNYSRGLPFCCVSIALMEEGKSLLGVVYDFNRDEMFSAVRGGGASLNGVAISTSTIEDPSQAILASGFPSYRDYGEESLTGFVRHVQRFKKVRCMGAAALSMAYVACGRVDAYGEESIMLWDVAAGLALVDAAGGWIDAKDVDGKKWSLDVRCGSSPKLWES